MDATRLSLRYAALSDVGRVRKDNQDSGFAGENLLAIADGVGGAARGDIASSTAVQVLRRLDTDSPGDPQEALAGAIHRTHDRLAELVDHDPELDGTSTTITAALFDGAKITVGHVGDSRGYLLRDGTLSQLTKDHTFVQSLIDEGRITEEEARTHPHKNLILRAVDGVHETEPDLFDVELAPGDRIMLCSDGCSGVLDAERLSDILATGSVDYAVVELVRAALEAGSNDNVTVVVADAVDADGPDAAVEGADATAVAAGGPLVVGAAAEQPRKAGATSKSFFRGHRGGDTGEMEPVPEIDPEALRYAPRAPRRFVWLRRGLVLLVLAVVLVGGAMLAYNWSQDQYYVAAAGESGAEKVAIYRGLESDLPGLDLHQVEQMTDITLQSLPEFRAEQVRAGIPADSPADARDIVQNITGFARVCPTPEPSPSADASKGGDRGGKNRGSKRASQSPSGTRSGGTDNSSGKPSRSPDDKSSKGASKEPSPSPTPTVRPPDCIEGDSANGANGAAGTAGGAS